MLFLHSHGVSTSRAVRIFKAYGKEAIEKVRTNPYTPGQKTSTGSDLRPPIRSLRTSGFQRIRWTEPGRASITSCWKRLRTDTVPCLGKNSGLLP
jgi:hypothetical protein